MITVANLVMDIYSAPSDGHYHEYVNSSYS